MDIGTKLVLAAIQYEGQIFTGRRHSTIQADNPSLPLLRKGVQGFCTDTGIFMDRDCARAFAVAHGQLSQGFSKTLTSEDLW